MPRLPPFLAALLLAACTGDFAEINTNPNAPADVPPALLLRQVTFSLADGLSYEGFTGGANLGQYFSADPGFNAFDRGNLLAPQFGGNPWPLLYTNLRDAELILARSRDNPGDAIYEGPARILRVFAAAGLTDVFGDVPYREAAAGRGGEVTPAYTPQADVYLAADGLLAELRAAVAAMDAYTGTAILEGDVLYGGDLAAWTRLANSLRLKLLLRASARLDDDRLAELDDVFTEGRYIDEASGDAVFAFGAPPNDFRFARARLGDFANYLESLTIDSVLNRLDDPREAVFFREAAAGGRAGVINGLGPETPYSADTVSLPGTIFREDAEVDWGRPAQQVHDFVRGQSPIPGAWTTWDGETVKLYRTRLGEGEGPPGTVLATDARLVVAAGGGAVEVVELQREGKRRMAATDFLNGAELKPGDRFGS